MNDVAQETPTWQTRLAQYDPELRVHLIGIGGAGLSAIAQVLLEMGIQVSGSDRQASAANHKPPAAGTQQHLSAALTSSRRRRDKGAWKRCQCSPAFLDNSFSDFSQRRSTRTWEAAT